MFAFTANVLQRFVYFRALNTTVPDNLDWTFKVLGSSWGIQTGKTDYSKSSAEYKQSLTDKIFGIEG